MPGLGGAALGHKEHREKSQPRIGVFVLTVSDTRTEATDESGALIKSRLADAGHNLTGYGIIPDEPDQVRGKIEDPPAGTQAFIITGGTGISRRDTTFDAIDSLLVKRLPGFGELFRMLSYEEIGSATIMSRATAGVTAGGIAVFSIPGSLAAVRLAMDKIIIPELGHIIWELNR